MSPTKEVISRFTVPGFHYWPNPPEKYGYLGKTHRHLFYFEVHATVNDSNREIEIIEFQDVCKTVVFGLSIPCDNLYHSVDFGTMSCEHIAEKLQENLLEEFGLKAFRVSVIEDNENGAILTW